MLLRMQLQRVDIANASVAEYSVCASSELAPAQYMRSTTVGRRKRRDVAVANQQSTLARSALGGNFTRTAARTFHLQFDGVSGHSARVVNRE